MKNFKLFLFALVSLFFLFLFPQVVEAQSCGGAISCQDVNVCCNPPSDCQGYTCTDDREYQCSIYSNEGECEGANAGDHNCSDVFGANFNYVTGTCSWYVGGGDPTPPPGCSCTSWVDGACGGGTCPSDKRRQTRTCTPTGCDTESRCVTDAACAAGPTPTPCPAISAPTGLSSSVSACPSPHSVTLSWNFVPGNVYTLAVWPPGATGWTYYYNITSSPQIGYGYTIPGTGSWAIGATSSCGSWSGYSYGSFTIPTCVPPTPDPTPYPAPVCTGYYPPPPTCVNVGGTLSMTATGVQNATKVEFFAFDRYLEGGNEQGDIVWYNATNQGGGTWTANISQSTHPNGNIVVGADLQNPDYWVWCSNWKEITVPCPTATPTPPPGTPLPTVTPTPSSTPTPAPICNRLCRFNSDCDAPVGDPIDYICYFPINVCRNVLCSTDADCNCSSTPTPTPVPTCTVSMSPNFSIPQGSSDTLTVTVGPVGIIADRVTFTSQDTGIVTVNPSTDLYPVFETELSGLSVGSTVVDVTAYLDPESGTTCTGSTDVEVTASVPWWQVIDGDVMTNGDLVSQVPSGQMFELPPPGESRFPGIPAYDGDSNLTKANVSNLGWIADSPHVTVNNKIYNYDYFLNLVPADVVWRTWPPSLIAPSTGYEWYKADTDLTINATNLGGRKVVLFVDGNLTVNGNITKTAGSGFFMAIVDGNITLSPDVTELQGLYSTDLRFSTGGGANPLHVLGSISAPTLLGGAISFGRNLLNNSIPAEVFEYDPSAIFLYPPELSVRGMKWKEITP